MYIVCELVFNSIVSCVCACVQATARSAPDREKEINNLVSVFVAVNVLYRIADFVLFEFQEIAENLRSVFIQNY